MPWNEGGSDNITCPSSEAESGDDDHCTLPGVWDVLKEHQSKTGFPRAPNPDALVKHAKKLNSWKGLRNGADEDINVQPFPLSSSKSLTLLIVFLLRMISVKTRVLLAQGNAGP